MEETDKIERQLKKEKKLEERHEASLVVCDYLMEGNPLRVALELAHISSSAFFEQKRLHADVRKAWMDAAEVRAELKISQIEELSEELIDSGPLNKETYNSVTHNLKWAVTKLLPDVYGTRPNAQENVITQNNINIMSSLTDEQILAIAGGAAQSIAQVTAQNPVPLVSSVPPASYDKNSLDNTIQVEYSEINDGSESPKVCPKVYSKVEDPDEASGKETMLNSHFFPEPATGKSGGLVPPLNNTQNKTQDKPQKFDLSVFADITAGGTK